MHALILAAFLCNTFLKIVLVVWQIILRQQRKKIITDLTQNLFTQLVVGSLTEIHHIVARRLPVSTQYRALTKMACLLILAQEIRVFNKS